MSEIQLFASESVAAGHPDKIADQISDALLDALLEQDARSRTGIEVLVSANQVTLAGEVKTGAQLDFESVARGVIQRLGYTEPAWGFYDGCEIRNLIHQQSPEISMGVDDDGAGDQGMMFGYAAKETDELMPLPITLAHALTKALDEARERGVIPFLRPDGKAQVVVRYENDQPVSIEHVTIATAHSEDVTHAEVKREVYKKVVAPILERYNLCIASSQLIVNGTGLWFVPGPFSDAGLTGRKIIVDSYGGMARVGGGAFSGKDPSKVDRSGAYAARYLAKNIVARGLADEAEVSLAYHIGAKRPVMTNIEIFGTLHATDKELQDFAEKLLQPSVKNIVEQLDLRRPIYERTAAYGHFGRSEFPWEKII